MKCHLKKNENTTEYCIDPGNSFNHVNREKMEKRMGGHIIFSHGTSASKGVAILFPEKLEYKILEKYSDSEGRLLIVKSYIAKTIYILTNCYAPTQQHKNDQINFIKMTKHLLNKFEHENIIIAGDFNFYMNPKLNKLESITHKHDNNLY